MLKLKKALHRIKKVLCILIKVIIFPLFVSDSLIYFVENHLSYDIDYGWINFLSGVMISTAINTFTSFCSSKDSNIYLLFAASFTFISSFQFFGLYQLINHLKKAAFSNAELNTITVSKNDLHFLVQKQWEQIIRDYKKTLRKKVLMSFWMGFLGLVVMMLFSFFNVHLERDLGKCIIDNISILFVKLKYLLLA